MRKLKTNIWSETPLPDNPFAPEKSFLYGQNFFKDLVPGCTFTDLWYLHLKGVKPTRSQSRHLELLLNLGANPGIRDESCRVAMNVAIGKGPVANATLAGLLARSGENRGARWIEQVINNIPAHSANPDPQDVGSGPLAPGRRSLIGPQALRDCGPFSGLGRHFGSADSRAAQAVLLFKKKRLIKSYTRFLLSAATDDEPVLLEGLIAAGFLDLGLSPVHGSLFFLMAAAPAMMAYSLEQWDLGYKEYPNFFEKGAFRYTGPAVASGGQP